MKNKIEATEILTEIFKQAIFLHDRVEVELLDNKLYFCSVRFISPNPKLIPIAYKTFFQAGYMFDELLKAESNDYNAKIVIYAIQIKNAIKI